MKISKIEVQKNNKERVNIYLDGEFAFGLDMELVYRHSLSKNMELDKDFIDKVLLDDERAKAKDTAFRFLSYRIRAEKEVYDDLIKKGFSEEIALETLDYLREQKLVDDLEFAKIFMRDKINLNNYGPMRIKNDLYLKGIDSSIISEVLEEDESEFDRAMKAGEKKIYSYRNDQPKDQYRKLSGFLQRRGFSYSVVKDVVKELVKW